MPRPEVLRRRLESQRWHRIEADWSPQGHALQTEGDDGSLYIAWQEHRLGPFLLVRIDEDDAVFGPFEVPGTAAVSAFTVVRLCVLQAEAAADGAPISPEQLWSVAAPTRFVNPSFDGDLRADFLARGGVGALIGAIAGSLLGGMPGIALRNPSVTSLGAHVGSIMGAAVGAYVGGYHFGVQKRRKKSC